MGGARESNRVVHALWETQKPECGEGGTDARDGIDGIGPVVDACPVPGKLKLLELFCFSDLSLLLPRTTTYRTALLACCWAL